MIAFAPLRTRRLDVRLRELSIEDEIALCYLPDKAHEKSISEFLTRIVESAAESSPLHLADPRAWSVGERLLVHSHYCVHTREDGPDYAVTEASKLTEYLSMERDAAAAPEPFDVDGDAWTVIPLSGAAAEVIEALQLQTNLNGYAHWIIGAMAAQLVRVDEQVPDAVAATSDYTEWLAERIATLRAYPSSGFEKLFAHFGAAVSRDSQFFRIWFDKEGVVVLPKEAGAATPPARFHVSAVVRTVSLSLAGKA